jgi:hypothetical protein
MFFDALNLTKKHPTCEDHNATDTPIAGAGGEPSPHNLYGQPP